jgi:hypothetical protein
MSTRARTRPPIPGATLPVPPPQELPPHLAAPVQALRRCIRCGTLTQDGVEVGSVAADAWPDEPVVACPGCLRPAERRTAR